MEPVFGTRSGQPVIWYSDDPARSNRYCLYCGDLVGVGSTIPSNKEHMIARNFVPSRSLAGPSFNFIFRACCDCNARKADAERHVSTVTLFNSPARAENPDVNALATHKAGRDFHPHARGQLVQDAGTEHTIHAQFGGAELSFRFIAPPQLDESRGAIVACNQIQALFALITSRDPTSASGTRLLSATQWKPLGAFAHGDWGNRQLSTVTQRVSDWPLLAGIVAANGYFKVVIRRRDEADGEWFWALEWNKSLRVVGAIFAADRNPPIFDDLPEHEWKRVSPTRRIRTEMPLPPEADALFSW